MKSNRKRLVREWENDVVAPRPQRQGVLLRGSTSNSAKRVCPHCDREFSNGRALGGHIRVHNRKKRKLSPAGGSSSNINSGRTRSREARAARAIARARRNNSNDRESGGGAGGNDSNDEVIDFSQNLSEFSWKVHKKRGSNNDKSDKKVEIAVVCQCMDDEDWDDGDDDGHSSVQEMLRRVGISCTAHPIIMTRRRFLCTVCDQYMLTIHAVCCHVREAHSSPDNSADDDHHQQPQEEENDEGGEEMAESEEGEQDNEDDQPEEGEGQNDNGDDEGEDEDEDYEEEEECAEESMEVEEESVGDQLRVELGVGEEDSIEADQAVAALPGAEEGLGQQQQEEEEEEMGKTGEEHGAEVEAEVVATNFTMEADEVAADQGAGAGAGSTDAHANIGGQMNQNTVASSDPPKRRNLFDLNELPPPQEQED